MIKNNVDDLHGGYMNAKHVKSLSTAPFSLCPLTNPVMAYICYQGRAIYQQQHWS